MYRYIPGGMPENCDTYAGKEKRLPYHAEVSFSYGAEHNANG